MSKTHLNRQSGGARAFCLLFALATVALTSACAQTRSAGPEVTLDRSGGKVSVLLMPADVELSLLTTGGLLEPNAAWTEQGRQNVIAALKEEMAERSVAAVSYADDNDPTYQIATADEQLVKLHEAVGSSIMLHNYLPGQALPTMKDRFDWTLGEGARQLREAHSADYALFVFAEDSFSSDGRVALNIALALIGAGVHGGRQVAFASLVDLDDGKVIWFNVLQSGVGDLRDPKLARQTVDQLLDSSPL
jgi:hypothetical protein